MAFEGDTRRFFGKALYVDGGRVEIVDPVGDGIIDQLLTASWSIGLPSAAGDSSRGQRMQP